MNFLRSTGRRHLPPGGKWLATDAGRRARHRGGRQRRSLGIGTDSGTYRWNGRGWTKVPGAAVGISVGRTGKP